MSRQVIDFATGNAYSLEHLAPFAVTYQILVEGEPVDVTLHVHFPNHCYTRSRHDSDPDEAVLIPEPDDRSDEERVFCINRWNFSQKLPDIIKNLHSKGCFPGGSKEIFYRQEDPPRAGHVAGWYLVFRLGVSNTHKNLTMSVRSVHYRYNKPYDIRGGSRRFYIILQQFYQQEKAKRDWL